MKEESSRARVYRLLESFRKLIGVGLLLLMVGFLIEGLAIFLRRWITLPIPLSIGIQVLLTIPCVLVTVFGIIWFNRTLNLVKIHFQGEEHELIASGPFNYVRHPLYSALLMGLPPLFVIWYADLLFIGSWLLVFILSHVLIRLEERGLIQTFGDDYRSYMKYVPALLPYKGAGGRRYRRQTGGLPSGRAQGDPSDPDADQALR